MTIATAGHLSPYGEGREWANAQRDIFGFERTREIAAAAKRWGQNVDITVVTVRRDP